MSNPNQQASQQGVALMLTLAVLALILILGMSFSFTARSGRQLAQNNAAITRVRLLAHSVLERTIAAIGYQYDEPQMPDDTSVPGDPRYPRLYPATAPTGTFGNRDLAVNHPLYGNRAFWLSTSATADNSQLAAALATQLGMGTSAAPAGTVARQGFIPQATNGNLPANASWHHITSPLEFRDVDGTVRQEDRLVGRIAFLVLDESGKLDPASLITINTEPVWDRADPANTFYDLNANNTLDHIGSAGWATAFREGNGNVPRRGLSPQEILLPLSANDFWDHVPTVGTGSVKTTWFGWHHIANTPAFNAENWTNVTANPYLATLFPYSYDIEAFRHTDDVDYHRFDLWQRQYFIDNGAEFWDDIVWDETALRDLYNGTIEPFWLTVPGGLINPDPSEAAPALGGFTDSDITLQVLANLVDFLDEDNAATFLPPGNFWNATVVGNEEQPYINEVAFIASYVMDDPDGIPASGDESGAFTLDVLLEVANIFDTDKDFTGTVRLDFTLNGVNVQEDLPVTGTATANDYTVVTAQWTRNYPAVPPPTPVVNLIIRDCRVALLDNWSADNGELADFAHVLDNDISATIDGTGFALEIHYANTQVEDPRCNTLPALWEVNNFVEGDDSNITMTIAVNPGPPPTITATGEINEIGGDLADPSNPPTSAAGYDAETVTDPVDGLSTAYIANRSDITFWELGAIHRGQPWQTINLAAYSENTPYRIYVDGDAILLDQLKLGGFTEVRGRFNANSAARPAWGSVFHQVRVGWEYEDTHDSSALLTAGTALNTAQALAIADDVLAQTADPAKGAPFASRAAFVNVPALSDGTGGVAQDTDRAQEEIIGKVANLLTVRQNLFTILVTAQSVLDTGTNDPGGSRSAEYQPGRWCIIEAEQKILATVYRDAFNNTFRVVNIEFLED